MWKTLADSFCDVGESPFWHPLEKSLYWVDIPARTVLRTRGDIADIENCQVERWRLPAEPGCIAPARSGGLVLAMRDGIYRAREWGGPLALLAPAPYDPRAMRFNDGKCDPLGRFWTSTVNEAKDGPTAALYCLDARAGAPRLEWMAGNATTGNGLAFAADHRTLYWSDTGSHEVRTYPWQAEPNVLGPVSVLRSFDAKPAGWTSDSGVPYTGRPDGATFDSAGRYWASLFEGAQLACLSTAGELLQTVPVPAQCPTMPCFGGGDLKTLFVTTARKGRPDAELARLPASGSVLSMQVDTAGVPVDFFED